MTQPDAQSVADTPANTGASHNPWDRLLYVPAAVSVEVPVAGLTVGDLFRLEKGSIVAADQLVVSNVPMRVGGRLIAWGEFQVAGEYLAARVAELA